MSRAFVPVMLALALTVGAGAGERYAATGMVLQVDPARRTFVASIDAIPGFMEAMAMPFQVRDARELAGLAPGVTIEFTVVVEKGASHAEGVRIRPYDGIEPDPLTARRLALFKDVTGAQQVKPVAVGQAVPDFVLTDQKTRRISLSQFRGKVVGINFTYTTCQLPDFCLRLVNHFGVLQKRFAGRVGRDLVFLTISFDPLRDRPEVLDRYANEWKANPAAWHFLTGPVADVRRVLGMFSMSAFPNDGLMDHTLRTALIDRRGALVANIEGNKYSSDQLTDLVRSVLDGPPAGPQRK